MNESYLSFWGQCGAHTNEGRHVGHILRKAWIFSLAPLYKEGFVSNTTSKSLCNFLNLADTIVVKHA